MASWNGTALMADTNEIDLVVLSLSSKQACAAGGEVIVPVVDGISPPAGSTITRSQTIIFDVTDNSGMFSDIWVWVEIGSIWEVVWPGEARGEFSPLYAQSSRSPISGGYRYTVKRNTGWPVAPIFHAIPIDSSGNKG